MEDIGIGYPSNLFDNIEKPIIVIDGDGLDAEDGNNDGVLDGDGQADARVNPDVHFGENGEYTWNNDTADINNGSFVHKSFGSRV